MARCRFRQSPTTLPTTMQVFFVRISSLDGRTVTEARRTPSEACGRSNWNGAVKWSWDRLPELLGAVRNSSLSQLPKMARP